MAHTAYGVEPNRRATYELRQSRYQALGESVAQETRRLQAEPGASACRLLDVGTNDGVARRYIEAQPDTDSIQYEAVDIFPHGKEFVYKHQDWKLHHIDLLTGMPSLPDDTYDIVICEQVLEHLTVVTPAIKDLVRVLKPGGMLIVGVPIFPEGAHLIRKHVVPVTDRMIRLNRVRGHVQAWSLRTFLREFDVVPELKIQQRRGFRIVSGGLLRSLEFTRAWWKINRVIGQVVPGLCPEVQLICRKTTPPAQRLARAA
ncbi:MAG: class I SAM-dependent methyltransferase [Pirellulaceae bacterium]